jgi:hypothetical protein
MYGTDPTFNRNLIIQNIYFKSVTENNVYGGHSL